MNYRFPLKSWIVDILRERQKDVNKGNTKMPFIIMSSAAKIVQSKAGANVQDVKKQIGEILENPNAKPEYRGCIITNHIDYKINYNVGKTIVGYDFDGKPIECKSESGRKISPVIIESLDIKADGTAMTRKIAMINLRCFSLHQLELIEQFFLQMGMHVLIEFGDNAYINEIKNNNILATKSNYDEFVKNFINKYQIPTATEFGEYLNDCRKSKGSYDRFAGILYDYNYKINADGTYSVMASYIQGNEINYQMPLTINTAYGTLVTKKEKPTYFEELMENVANDLPGMDLEFLKKLDSNEWQGEFFNFNKESDSTDDSVVSSTPYVSLKFILEIIVNNLMNRGGTNPDFKLKIPNAENNRIFKIGNNYEKIIPIKIHKFITAQDDAVLFPNKAFPKYGITDKGVIVINTKELVDASINNKSIVVNDDVEFIHPTGNIKINLQDPFVIGNALNIFVDYNRIITAWRQSYSRNDFLVQILELINDRGFGIFKLGYGNIYENSLATIIDFKLFSELDFKPTERDPARIDYRFNPLSVNSIIRDFDFTFNMDSNAAAIAIQNANAFVAEHRYKDSTQSTSIEFRDRIYGLSSYSNHATVDGLYSINQIQYQKLLPPTGDLSLYKGNEDGSTPYDPDYTDSVNTELINFKLNPKDKKSIRTLAVSNADFLYTKLLNKEAQSNNTQVLTNISISFKLDGISGFNIGETFQIDGVPEMRNKIGEFRIGNIQHTIDNQIGWVTSIEADWTYKYKP